MSTVRIKARIDPRLKQALDEFCRSRGIAMNHFILEANLDRFEEFEDTGELKAIRHEPTRPLTGSRQERARTGGTGNDPHPLGSRKLSGYTDVLRLRVGVYRILHSVEGSRLFVIILKIEHRKDGYR